MSRVEHEPQEVIPISETPSSEVFPVRYRDHYSDIFPTEGYEGVEGMLGNYVSGDPQRGDPLEGLVEGMRAQRRIIYEVEDANGGKRTEKTRKGLYATMLHVELASSINQSYKNLIIDGLIPTNAVDTIATYIDVKYTQKKTEYNSQLEHNAAELSALDKHEDVPQPSSHNGIPILRLNDLLKVPMSPEVERMTRMDNLVSGINSIGRRLQRLDFEKLSSDKILEILKATIGLS